MAPLRVALYPRISLDQTGEGLGMDRQLDAGRAIANGLGPHDLRLYAGDNSVSGSKPRKATSDYARLLADCRAGRIDVVIVWDLDRLTRIPRELEDWIDLADEGRGVRLITMDGEVDTRSENGRMFMRIKAAVARHEVEHKGARMQAANKQRAEKGAPRAGGARAFGYTSAGDALVEAEADLIRKAYADLLAGASLRGIAQRWNTLGVRTCQGNEWRPNAVRRVMLNPRNAALVVHKGIVLDGVPGSWPAIIGENVYRGVVALLEDPARLISVASGGPRKNLLSNLAICGVEGCGSLMTTGATKRGVRTLKCKAARHLERAAEEIEGFVIVTVLDRIRELDAEGLLAVKTADLAPLHTEAKALRKQRAAVAANLALPEDAMTIRINTIDGRLAEIDAAVLIANAENILAEFIGKDPVEVWKGRDLDRRRAWINALADVTVLPTGRGARGFRTESVEIDFGKRRSGTA